MDQPFLQGDWRMPIKLNHQMQDQRLSTSDQINRTILNAYKKEVIMRFRLWTRL